MQINITRPVVISTAKGLRHFVPGTQVDVPQVEAEQILRQQAGSVVPLLDDTTRKKKPQGLATREPEKAQSAAVQPDPALLADASIMAASTDFGGDSFSDSSADSAGGE